MIEFDLSFTQDPQWISEREKEWQELLPRHPTMTKKQLKDFKAYFLRELSQKVFLSILWMPYAIFQSLPSLPSNIASNFMWIPK